MNHGSVVNEIVLAVGSLPYARCWKHSTGTAVGFSGNIVRFGLEGSPDIVGILEINEVGYFLGIEVKVGKDRQSTMQKNFQRMVEGLGGFYKVCGSVDDALNFIRGMREEKCRT